MNSRYNSIIYSGWNDACKIANSIKVLSFKKIFSCFKPYGEAIRIVHGFRCPDDARSHGISSEAIDLYDKLYQYDNVIMNTMASQITSITVVYSIVYSDADQRKHQSSASLAFVWGIHRDRWIPPHKRPVTRKKFPFDDVIMLAFEGKWRQISFGAGCLPGKMAL